MVLGGRVLREFGDDPTRFTDAASRRRYAGTAPITKASGKSRVVLLRQARKQRLTKGCRWGTSSPALQFELNVRSERLVNIGFGHQSGQTPFSGPATNRTRRDPAAGLPCSDLS